MAWAGLFNEQVDIYDFVKIKTKQGIVSEELKLVYSTRAKVSHASGSRKVINDQIQTPYVKTFVLRIYVPIQDTSWIKYQDKYYQVTSIDVDKVLQQQVVIAELVTDYDG
jgi:hypothetical protein